MQYPPLLPSPPPRPQGRQHSQMGAADEPLALPVAAVQSSLTVGPEGGRSRPPLPLPSHALGLSLPDKSRCPRRHSETRPPRAEPPHRLSPALGQARALQLQPASQARLRCPWWRLAAPSSKTQASAVASCPPRAAPGSPGPQTPAAPPPAEQGVQSSEAGCGRRSLARLYGSLERQESN